MASSWLNTTSFRAICLLLLGVHVISAQLGSRQPAGPGYSGRDACPVRCSLAGPRAANWSVYHNFDQFQSCQQTMFYEFSLYDHVDDPKALHRIYACSSYGPDWTNLPDMTPELSVTRSTNVTYEIGWWSDGTLASAGFLSVIKQMRQYLASGYGTTNKTLILLAQSGQSAVGLYIGKGLQNENVGSFALKSLEDSIPGLGQNTSSLGMQLCKPGYDGDHIFGLIATRNATFGPIQGALRSWSNSRCISFKDSLYIPGPALLTTPLVTLSNGTNTTAHSNSSLNTRSKSNQPVVGQVSIVRRGNCRTIQVYAGNGCGDLASRCGVSGADFTTYNPGSDFCSTLVPFQHVCCSLGTLPDFRPKPNPDGSCATYFVQNGDYCSKIAAAHGMTIEELEVYNQKTWGWNGCGNVWAKSLICLTTGTPPMPAYVNGAVCGPQVPGTSRPTDGSDIAGLNPCPLNACCDVWGQCGTTAEFCTDTGTGAPGTAKPGTNGCISNCGTNIIRSSAPNIFRTIGYFEGFGMNRPCLHMDALQIDGSKYTHLHFAFGTITPDYQVTMGDQLTEYEFHNFKRISGPAKILSFGGWDFSTGPSTYTIFRQGVLPANRLKLATNIANFIKYHNLDGVDIDWEYPAAPDIPNIPPGDKAEGYNYLAFLAVLKNLLPGKSISIAAPASYWYLKGFPIAQIGKIVDYIIYMTYDLHGQWDAQNQYSQEGCPSGMCLRSGVNLTETVNALVMITKAGVPSNKVVVGVTSYGRSFAMAQAGCYTPDCLFTGTPSHSNAAKGPCTDTAGYISNAEINDIIKDSSRVNHNFIDPTSNSNILVYDNTQWVGWMSSNIRATRTALYRSLSMGGTTNWAIDLDTYHDPPEHSASWKNFVVLIKGGRDPYQYGDRTGNWTSVLCSDRAVADIRGLSSSERWNRADAPNAWKDAINVWKTIDKIRDRRFTESVLDTFHGPEGVDCGDLSQSNNCDSTRQCHDFVGSGTGPAAYFIYNSLVLIHQMYATYYTALFQVAASAIGNSLSAFADKFAPVPPNPDTTWLKILLDLVGMGATMVAGPFFNSFLAKMPYFLTNTATLANSKDTTLALISGGTGIAKNLLSGSKSITGWTEQKQHDFAAYMGQVIVAWGNFTEMAVKRLFDGSDESISALTTIISDGKLIDGSNYDVPVASDLEEPHSMTALQGRISKVFFSYAIPTIWALSGTHPFIADSGYPCGTIDPLKAYISTGTMSTTWACYQNKMYYLVAPKGKPQTCTAPNPGGPPSHCDSNLFSAPPGLDSLDGKSTFGGVTLSDLIIGSVRTYLQNGNTNGGGPADPTNSGTANDFLNSDVTTPGFIRIPVCSPDMAWKAWNGQGGPSTSTPNYPCIIPTGKDDCGDSTFVDQTSNASPKVSDCQQIVRNIQGTDGEWGVENAIGAQHQLVQFGECKFGVQGQGKNGNVHFKVGAQDIVDIINDSIQRFGGSGRVGAKGVMSCRGNVEGQDVEWGLY